MEKKYLKFCKFICYLFYFITITSTQNVFSSENDEDRCTSPPPLQIRINEREVVNSTLLQNFKEGDLLYGLEEARAPYRNELERSHGVNGLYTADHYNNRIIGGLLGKNKESFLNTIATGEGVIEDGLSLKKTQALLNYRSYIILNINEDFFSKQMSEENIIKRLCKDAIKYIVYTGKKVHFLLDKINMHSVTDEKQKGYTKSELRYIFRNWSNLKDCVVFYRNGQVALQPWNNEHKWGKYIPRKFR